MTRDGTGETADFLHLIVTHPVRYVEANPDYVDFQGRGMRYLHPGSAYFLLDEQTFFALESMDLQL